MYSFLIKYCIGCLNKLKLEPIPIVNKINEKINHACDGKAYEFDSHLVGRYVSKLLHLKRLFFFFVHTSDLISTLIIPVSSDLIKKQS